VPQQKQKLYPFSTFHHHLGFQTESWILKKYPKTKIYKNSLLHVHNFCQFWRRKLVEGPNNGFPFSADFKFRIYFVKLISKFGKIGFLDDLSGQGSSSKDFICGLDLGNGLGLRPQKEKSRFGCLRTVGLWKSYFFACSSGIYGQQMVKNQSPWAFYNGFNPLEPFSFEIFGKYFSNQILVEQGKILLLLEKPSISQKSGIRFEFLKYFLYNLE
jgi:hypothetical protein